MADPFEAQAISADEGCPDKLVVECAKVDACCLVVHVHDALDAERASIDLWPDEVHDLHALLGRHLYHSQRNGYPASEATSVMRPFAEIEEILRVVEARRTVADLEAQLEEARDVLKRVERGPRG